MTTSHGAFLRILRAFFESVGDDDMTPERIAIAQAIVEAWIRGMTFQESN